MKHSIATFIKSIFKKSPSKSPDYWNSWYKKYGNQGVSWFQEHSEKSLQLIAHAGLNKESQIIDVGGGASILVDELINSGYQNITVLDLSSEALNVAVERLGERSKKVTWCVGDITKFKLPPNYYDIWHDRAVFHFLTTNEERQAYLQSVMRSLKVGGHIIISTFASDGPTECSGLLVTRYSHTELHQTFGNHFKLIEHADEFHHTPSGKEQHFIYCHCARE